jgi:hypothetical protein
MNRSLQINMAIAIIVAVALTGCASDEERARKVLEANASGILACDELYAQSGAALEATLDAMQKGEWSSAAQQLHAEARPATRAYAECMNRERANLASKLEEAGIPDSTAARVSESWWQEKRQQLDAARKAR